MNTTSQSFVFSLYCSTFGITLTAICAYDLPTIDEYMDGRAFPGDQTVYYVPDPPYGENFPDSSSQFAPGQVKVEAIFFEAIFAQLNGKIFVLR